MRTRSITVVMAMAAGGVLAAASTPAAALPNTFGALVPTSITDYRIEANIPPGQNQTATAPCPAGMSEVGVGGGAPGNSLNFIAAANGTSAVVSAPPGIPTDPNHFVQAVVSCAPSAQLAGTTTATRESTGHTSGLQGMSWGGVVTCPAGMRAFGGGGYFRSANGTLSTGYAMSYNSLSPNDRSWIVRAKNSNPTDTLVVTTRCAYESTSTRIVQETYPAVSGRANGYAHCPAGYLPISGGAQIVSDNNVADTYETLMYSTPVRNGQIGWFALGSTSGTNGRLNVWALCDA
jgi:hypothetical protein